MNIVFFNLLPIVIIRVAMVIATNASSEHKRLFPIMVILLVIDLTHPG
jgi:hypothetical protein